MQVKEDLNEMKPSMDLNGLSNEFPFDHQIDQMTRDSINEFGAGDCWGNVQSFSMGKYSIWIDTTNCGDFGFCLNFYLLENGSLRILNQVEGDYSSVDDKQIIKEDIYDFRSKPFTHQRRIDTSIYSIDNYTINKLFLNIPMEDFQTTYAHIIMKMKEPWGMTIDY
jgi:hypothetical protein